jgi:NAD(P)-dependent dehydrogenase (short-subunit alcohol dehydrogenase family)
MSGALDGRVAVITGGSAGIGLATAARFLAEGAFVVIVGRRQNELDKAVANLGRDVTAVQGDSPTSVTCGINGFDLQVDAGWAQI